MVRLPLEIWWKIFERVLDKNPDDLWRLRAVCTNWKIIIDQMLFKKWNYLCRRDIPDECIDNIVAARFPLAALPWQNAYWENTQYMSEFLKNDKLMHTKLWSKHYAIVENECFSFSEHHFEHYIFSKNTLKKNVQVTLPELNSSFKRAEISDLRISDMELQVIMKKPPPRNKKYNTLNIWIFKCIILRDLNGKLNFDPCLMLKQKECTTWSASKIVLPKISCMDTLLYFKSESFSKWFADNYQQYSFASLLAYGNYLIIGTNNDSIIVVRQRVHRMLKDFLSGRKATARYAVINLLGHKIDGGYHVPLGVAYTNSNLRILVLSSNHIVCVDFPLIYVFHPIFSTSYTNVDIIHSDSGIIWSRLFDHRPFIQGEVSYFVHQFESSRGDREIERLFKILEYSTELTQTQTDRAEQLGDDYLPSLKANTDVALSMCERILRREENFDLDTKLIDLRTERKNNWEKFCNDMSDKCRKVDQTFAEKEEELKNFYVDLETKLHITL